MPQNTTEYIVAKYFLDTVTLLKSLSAEQRREIEQISHIQNYEAGHTILRQGETSRDLKFLISGKAKVIDYASSGREIGFAFLEGGSHFGDFAVIDGQPRSVTIEAITPCIVGSLDHTHARALFEANPQIMWALLIEYAGIIRRQDAQLVESHTCDATRRVYKLLLRMAQTSSRYDHHQVVSPLPNQSNLGSMANTSRETVSRAISRLKRLGITEKVGSTLIIRNMELLSEFAGTAPH